MFRLAALTLLACLSAATAQNPYIAADDNRPRVTPDHPVPPRGTAIGHLDTRPSFSTAPQISPTPALPPPSYTGSSGGFMMSPYGFGYGAGFVNPNAAYLQGLADYTVATGQYWKDIQAARITREQATQMSLDTQRKKIQFEMDYERLKYDTARRTAEDQRRALLQNARRDPPMTEVWSGQTLNILLKSILDSSNPTAGPNIPLDEEVLRGINLIDKSSRANVSLSKDEGKISWPIALQEEVYDESRDQFSKLFSQAMGSVGSGVVPDFKLLREMRKLLKELNTTLEARFDSTSPGEYLAARRVLGQLKEQVNGMSDPGIVKGNKNWRASVKTVADLVGFCMKNGMEFGGSVSPGDQRAYSAAYYSLRNYERELYSVARR